jgi:WD40 repeat protein
MIYPDLGDKEPVAVTPAGAMYLTAEATETDVTVVPIDLATGRAPAAPFRPAQRFVGTNSLPEWSPDGKYLAYLSSRSRADGGNVVVIHGSGTWEIVRELRPGLTYPTWLRWSPDGRTFAASGTDSKGRIGVFRIDAETGETTAIATPRDDFFRGFRPVWSGDGKRILYQLPGGATIEHDLDSGVERRVTEALPAARDVSPNGEWFASTSQDGAVLLVQPATGGPARELLRLPGAERVAGHGWTGDSRGLVLRRAARDGTRRQFWFIPLAGTPVALDLTHAGAFRLDPGGRFIAFITAERRREVYVLENFLPPAGATR